MLGRSPSQLWFMCLVSPPHVRGHNKVRVLSHIDQVFLGCLLICYLIPKVTFAWILPLLVFLYLAMSFLMSLIFLFIMFPLPLLFLCTKLLVSLLPHYLIPLIFGVWLVLCNTLLLLAQIFSLASIKFANSCTVPHLII